MAENRKRTMVEFPPGGHEPLRRDLRKYKRGGQRLKELATLGLAAESHGLSYHEVDGRLRLAGATLGPSPALLVGDAGIAPAAAPAPDPTPEPDASTPIINDFMSQFED